MRKEYSEQERQIRPYKTTNKKCETEEDLKDMVRLASENILGVSKSGKVEVYGNRIQNPENLLTDSNSIAEQFIAEQEQWLGGEKCRSRRVNVMTYLIDEKKYGIDMDGGAKLAQGLIEAYPEYSSVIALNEKKGILRMDHISSNLCGTGIRMTQVFKPLAVYNKYKNMKNERSE